MSSLTDLFEFLHSPNPDARHLALQNLLGQTPKNSPYREIFIPSLSCPMTAVTETTAGSSGIPARKASAQDAQKLELLQDLKTLTRDQAHIAHDAFSALVNLADGLNVARHLVDEEFLSWLVSYTANHTSPLSPLSAMLLSNITSHSSLTPHLATLTIPIIRFSNPNSDPISSNYPPYFYPLSISSSSTIHPLYRPDQINPDSKDLEAVEAIRVLVQAFEEGGVVSERMMDGNREGEVGEVEKKVETGAGRRRKGGVHFLGSVFANMSMLPSTRPLLLTPFPPFPIPASSSDRSTSEREEDEPLLTKICVYTEHSEVIRRGGALGCIKNAAMDRSSHPFLLATELDRIVLPNSDPKRMVKGVDVLPWVLGPLMGGEEVDLEEAEELPLSLQMLSPDKIRERDPVLRLMCVEILLLLATSFTGRESLRKRGTYIVIRLAHEAEKDEQISEHMIRLVSLLKRDESEDSMRDHLEHLQPAQAQAPPSVATIEEEDGDSDLEIEVI